MEIKVCIHVMRTSHQKYPDYVRETITESELWEWAKKYVADNFSEGHEAVGIDVESIIP